MTELPDILKPLWTGESVFCASCKHHLNMHFTNHFPEELAKEGYPFGHCFRHGRNDRNNIKVSTKNE